MRGQTDQLWHNHKALAGADRFGLLQLAVQHTRAKLEDGTELDLDQAEAGAHAALAVDDDGVAQLDGHDAGAERRGAQEEAGVLGHARLQAWHRLHKALQLDRLGAARRSRRGRVAGEGAQAGRVRYQRVSAVAQPANNL